MAKKGQKKANKQERPGVSQPQGFTHGMISDLDPHFQLKGSYSDAQNIRLTNSEGDTFTVENIEGNSLFVDLSEYPITIESTSNTTNYPTFYDRGPNGPYAAAPVNESYSVSNLKIDNRASIVGHYSYANQLFLIIVARFEYKQDGGQNAAVLEPAERTIFLMVDFNEKLEVQRVLDYRYCYNAEGWNYPDLGMKIDQPVTVEAIVENNCLSRVYWTDNINPLRTLNLNQGDKIDIVKTSLDITPLMNATQATVSRTLSGSLPVGVYQYTYKYISENGGETTFGPLSNIYHVSDQSFSSSTTYGGGPRGNIGSQGFNVVIKDIDQNFEYVELYSLFYEEAGQPPKVAVVGQNRISSGESTFQHVSWSNQVENGLEEVLIESNTWDICKDIAIKDNILFAANLKQKKNWISEKEWNVKIMRWRIAPSNSGNVLDACLTTHDEEVKHYNKDNTTNDEAVEILNRPSNVAEKDYHDHRVGHGELLGFAHSVFTVSNRPYIEYDGNYGNPTWRTCISRRVGVHGQDSHAIWAQLEYRFLPDRMTLGGESYNYRVNELGGCRVTFGVKQREVDQSQNTASSPYISATATQEEFSTEFETIHDASAVQPVSESGNTKVSTSMSLGGTKDPHAAGEKRGYQRGEVYRFGVQVYDLNGAPGNVLWIGDIQMPWQYDILRMIDLEGQTTNNDYSPFRPTIDVDPSFSSYFAEDSLLDRKAFTTHPFCRDHKLSAIYGHAVPPPDVEWFTAQNASTYRNLEAYIKPNGDQVGTEARPFDATSGEFAHSDGRVKGLPLFYNAYNSNAHGWDSGSHTDTHYCFDLYVNFEFLIPEEVCKKISGYRVVRAKRNEEDRSIIQQGLLNQTAKYGDASLGRNYGYDGTKFSTKDNKGFDDDPVFVNQWNDQSGNTNADPTFVEQPEYDTYLNGYIGLAENSNLARYDVNVSDGKLTTGGNSEGMVFAWPETEDTKKFPGHGAQRVRGWNGTHYGGPGTHGENYKHCAYFGTYDKMGYRNNFHDSADPTANLQAFGAMSKANSYYANLPIVHNVFTLDSPDSAFGIRPYSYREGDRLIINTVLKLSDQIRYKNGSGANWSTSFPIAHYTHCRTAIGEDGNVHLGSRWATILTEANDLSTNSSASWDDWLPINTYSTISQALTFCKRREINEHYSVLVGKYYCYETQWACDLEISGGERTIGDGFNRLNSSLRVRESHGEWLPIGNAKELSDGEIVPSGFFKYCQDIKNGVSNGFSNNTLGFMRNSSSFPMVAGSGQSYSDADFRWEDFNRFFTFGAVNRSIAYIKSHNNQHTSVKAEDYTYDTVSTLQMGLRSILIEVNDKLTEARKFGPDPTNTYWRTAESQDSGFSNRQYVNYASWFHCHNVSAIYEHGKGFYGVMDQNTIGTSNNGVNGYVNFPVSPTYISHHGNGSVSDEYNHYPDTRDANTITDIKIKTNTKAKSLHPHKYLCSIHRTVTPYSGHTKGAIEKTRYIPAGNFHPVQSESDTSGQTGGGKQGHVSQVFGGDTFVNFYSHQKTSTPYMKNSAARWQVFPVESYVNTDMRSGLTLNSGDVIIGKEMNEAPFSNDWLYNSVYSQENTIKSGLMIDEDESCENLELPYEIAYSNTKILGQKTDSFRQFPINQFHDMEGLYGEINAIVNFKNEIYVLQDTAFAKLLVNPLSMLSDDSGTSLFTGTGETVENHIYISTKYGSRHKFSVAQSEKSLYFVDVNFARLFKYDTEKLISLGDALGQRNYLKYIMHDVQWKSVQFCNATSGGGAPFGTITTTHQGAGLYHGVYKGHLNVVEKYGRNYHADNPLKFLGITSIYDFDNKELMVTFHNSNYDIYDSNGNYRVRHTFANPLTLHSYGSTTNGQPIKKSETLVYNEGINAFTSKYTVAPPQWLSGGQGSFILCPENEICVESILNRSTSVSTSYLKLPYNIYGSYDSNFYKQYRVNPLKLWRWGKHKKSIKGNFFGKRNNTDVVVTAASQYAATTPVNSNYTGGVDNTKYKTVAKKIIGDEGYVIEESYIEKVINSEASDSKIFDNAEIVMRPNYINFSSVEYDTDTTIDTIKYYDVIHDEKNILDNTEELIINKRWSFGETSHSWQWTDGIEGTKSMQLNTGQTVEITSIDHPVTGTDGQYGYADISLFNNLIGYDIQSETIVYMYVERSGSLVYEGFIKAWDDTNANSTPSSGTGNMHFRKNSGNAAGDFQVGDILYTSTDKSSARLDFKGDGKLRSSFKHENALTDYSPDTTKDFIGKYNNIIRARIRRVDNTNSTWQGSCYFRGMPIKEYNEGNRQYLDEDPGRRVDIPEPEGIDNGWVICEFNMSGVDQYNDSYILQIRLDFDNGSGPAYEVDYVEIAGLNAHRYSDGVLKAPLRTHESKQRSRGTWSKIKYKAKTPDKFNIFAILAKYRKTI